MNKFFLVLLLPFWNRWETTYYTFKSIALLGLNSITDSVKSVPPVEDG